MNNDIFINSQKWLEQYFHKLTLAFIVLAGVITIGTQTMETIQDLSHGSSDIQPSQQPENAKPLAASEFNLIFGQADLKPNKQKQQVIPKTTLNLHLRGALAGNSKTESSAIIQGSDGQDHLYKVGQSLPGGAVLDSVFTHYVVINYHGTLQKLMFPDLGKELKNQPPPNLPDSNGKKSGFSEANQEYIRALEQRQNND